MSEPLDVLAGRVWPERERMTPAELIRAFETVMAVEPRLHVRLYMYGANEFNTQNWSISGTISVDGYMSAEEFLRLRDALAEHGMYPYIGSGGEDSGDVQIAIGSKTWQGVTTGWRKG